MVRPVAARRAGASIADLAEVVASLTQSCRLAISLAALELASVARKIV
jgi:hypothetical protein